MDEPIDGMASSADCQNGFIFSELVPAASGIMVQPSERRPNVMRWNGPLRQHLVLKRGRCSNATKEGQFHEVC